MIDVVSSEVMRSSDAKTIQSGISGTELMERAALGIYKSVEWCYPVLIVCGGGNNAGDGYALAEILQKEGILCEILRLSDKISEDSKHYFDICVAKNIKMIWDVDDFSHYKIIVDCIFGTGFHGILPDDVSKIVEKINNSGAYIVSADINSGLNSDNGVGNLCVISDLTVSIGTYKSGHFLNMAKDVMKKKVNCDIGIDISGEKYFLIEKSDIKKCFPERKNFSNKGTYGYVTLMGGCVRYGGAIKLANLSLCALKTGAGVSKLAVPEEIAHSVAPYMLESTLYPVKSDNGYLVFDKNQLDEIIKSSRVICLGMGMGQGGENEKIIEYILKNYDSVFIIDADGINSLAKTNKEILKKTKCKVVLTPHIMEFSRLTGYDKNEIINNTIPLAKKYAKDMGLVLLLKGTATVITDGERVFITDKGSPAMATAGSGDVLSGIICGVCSQNINGDLLLNVACASYVNGRSGEIAEKRVNVVSALSSDTVNAIPASVNEILE